MSRSATNGRWIAEREGGISPIGTIVKHATSRILFSYWDALRGERSAPERAAVQPGEIRHVLADTFILGLEAGQPPRFRLSGTRMTALFGRDLAGTRFDRFWEDADRHQASATLDILSTETVGAVVGVLGLNANGSELPLELLLLPLRHHGRTDARVLGAMSPASIPSWAGLVPLVELRLRSTRMIEPLRSRVSERPVETPRQRFVVHEGGRA